MSATLKDGSGTREMITVVWAESDLRRRDGVGRQCVGGLSTGCVRPQNRSTVLRREHGPTTIRPVDVMAALQSCGGAASWRRLRALGVTWYAMWRAVSDGRALRVRRGAYALPAADAAAVAVVRLGGVLSCTSAARCLGLPVLVECCIHLTVPRSWGHARLAGVRVHRRDLDSDEHDEVSTGLLRTVLDCARELSVREAVAIGDAALRTGLTTGELETAASREMGRGAPAIRRAVALMDGCSESPIESCLRLLLREFGRVEAQVLIAGVGRVDFLVDRWLVVEADGFAHHSTRDHYREDRRRANALAARGYVLLRFTYEDAVHRPEYVVETVRAVLARRAA